jgi:hypothetical protein
MKNFKTQVIFEKVYDAESIVEIDDDIHWTLNESSIPVDEYGLHRGKFEVIVTWIQDSNESEYEEYNEYEEYEKDFDDSKDYSYYDGDENEDF